MATQDQRLAEGLRNGTLDAEQVARVLEGGKVRVKLTGRFRPGTKIRLVRRHAGQLAYSPGGELVGTETMGKDQTVEFSGSDIALGDQFWAVGQDSGDEAVRAVAVTAKPAPAGKRSVKRDGPVEQHWPTHEQIRTEEPRERSRKPAVGPVHPHLRQEDVPEGTWQRSDTRTGQATPVDPTEWIPQPPQYAVPEGTPQRSDTPLGYAAIVPEGEGSPYLRQEDMPPGTLQRSSTPTGQAVPIQPGELGGRDAVKDQQAKDSSAQKAIGGKEPGKVAAKGRTETHAPTLPDAEPYHAPEARTLEDQAAEAFKGKGSKAKATGSEVKTAGTRQVEKAEKEAEKVRSGEFEDDPTPPDPPKPKRTRSRAKPKK